MHLLRARLAAPGSSALPGKGLPLVLKPVASGSRVAAHSTAFDQSAALVAAQLADLAAWGARLRVWAALRTLEAHLRRSGTAAAPWGCCRPVPKPLTPPPLTSSARAPPQGAPGGSGQLGTPEIGPPWVLEPAASKAAHSTASDRPGRASPSCRCGRTLTLTLALALALTLALTLALALALTLTLTPTLNLTLGRARGRCSAARDPGRARLRVRVRVSLPR